MDPDAADDDDGITPLMLASENGHVDVAHLLLEAGALPDSRDNRGETALMDAAHNGHLDSQSENFRLLPE